MLNDFHMFEAYIASSTFINLPEIEKEEFLFSYHNLLEEEMDFTLQQAKQYLHQRSISDLFFRIYGHLDSLSLREKDEQWTVTFGFSPYAIRH